jgi:hypothetical protein
MYDVLDHKEKYKNDYQEGSEYATGFGIILRILRWARPKKQCCRSGSGCGSGRIRIILPDPNRDRHPGHADPNPADPDRFQCQEYEKVDKQFFFHKISICSQSYVKL